MMSFTDIVTRCCGQSHYVKNVVLVLVACLLTTGCEYGWWDDEPFEPFQVDQLTFVEPVDIGPSWDDYRNRDKTIPEGEKMLSAQAVHSLVLDGFNPEEETGDADVWRDMPLYNLTGDCEDFALTCKELLLSQHWRESDVLLLSSQTHTSAGVIINGGIYILCNMESEVIPLAESPYEWWDACRNGRWYAVEYN